MKLKVSKKKKKKRLKISAERHFKSNRKYQ